MTERSWKCPNCGALLKPRRFAREATCEYCGAVVPIEADSVSVQRFRDAYNQWNVPRPDDGRAWFTLGDGHWTTLALLAHGEIADVYLAESARRPARFGLLKILREAADLPMLELEWRALHTLKASDARGAAALAPRVPDPIARGVIEGGKHSGSQAVIHRWAPGFEHTFEAVRAAYPRGVEPRVAVWMWRRLLELLGFLHDSGVAHGAVLPQHLLVERGEHGLRLVGYGCATRPGAALAAVVSRYETFYPRALLDTHELQRAHDLSMSARCIAFALGADDEGRLASSVPAALRALLESAGEADAWNLHERLGTTSRELFGPPSFHPLVMPAERASPQPR